MSAQIGADFGNQAQSDVSGPRLCIVDINGDGFQKITDDPHGDTDPNWLAVAAN